MNFIFYEYMKKAWKTYTNDCEKFFMGHKVKLLSQELCGWEKKLNLEKKWADLDYMYIPILIQGLDHFILAQIDLVNRKVRIYGDAHNKLASNSTRCYSIIGSLLSFSKFFEHRKDIEEGEFELELVKGLDIQSCG